MLHPRARTMLILSVPAILIGIACSLILIVAMKVAALLQRVLWSNLPAQLGVSADSPLWIIAMLTATGIAVGLVIRYSPGHAGPDPATESLIGAPIATGALPGLLAALILGLAGGVSLGTLRQLAIRALFPHSIWRGSVAAGGGIVLNPVFFRA
ncbi:hypothetical protein ACLBQS_25120, partial [Klebsiella pneumoniae]